MVLVVSLLVSSLPLGQGPLLPDDRLGHLVLTPMPACDHLKQAPHDLRVVVDEEDVRVCLRT